ncbi:MAG: cell surface protein SprA, partial [Bacteroidota bacterium]|nr:cell surface protein SprA [Bacteroidota bacterium]
MRESFRLLLFTVLTAYCLLSIGFATRGSVANDPLLDGASFQFLCSISNAANSKIPPLEHSNSRPEKLQDNSLSSGIATSLSDSAKTNADSLKLIKDKKVQQKADSLMYRNIGLSDTTKKAKNDSVKVLTWRDSLAAKSKDSTARIENFHYKRHDQPNVEFNPKKRSKFFAYPSSSVLNRTVELDSSGNFVLIKERIGNEPYKILLQVPIDEYIKLKLAAHNRDLWEEMAYKYELKDKTKDIGALITDITNIDIPLPSVGFLSIFGKRGINIKINGAVDIHGAWRNETTEGVTASLLGNSRNEPDFRQTVQINVQGTIGDKLKIGADWNTERTFEYENQLKLTYTGYEDEIVQKVEAGNVSLQTSPLVGGSEALFGVKANFQLGPLSLTTLASQKKGEIKEVSISGGTTTQEFQKRVYDYSTNHYFIDDAYADTSAKGLFNSFYGDPNHPYDPNYYVWEIEVWKSVIGPRQLGVERQANAFFDLKFSDQDDYKAKRDTTIQSVQGTVETGRFILLTPGTDYELHKETGFITFKTQIQDQDVIAVSYKLIDPNSPSGKTQYRIKGDFLAGSTDTSSTKRLVLKLIKPKNLQPSDKAWNYQLKNIYAIGGRQINQDGFSLDIVYQTPGQEPQNAVVTSKGSVQYLQAFGLDKVGAQNTGTPDGNFDFIPGTTIIPETGEIVFPMLRPFGNDLPSSLPDTLKYNSVYENTVTQAKLQGNKDRFIIKGKYSAASSSVFNLPMVGIVENSVKVRLNGAELTPNVDYVVDYNIGQVTIRNSSALVPGADLKITYEQNDIFQLASKTLLGARGEFNFSKKTTLGFSALNLNQQTLTDKVRIGEEPLNNSIYGIDFGTSLDLPFLTKGLDKLISTREMSSLSVKGEFAYINPDPNTKKSPIASDGGRSIAYIDDFEGSKKTIPVGLGYTQWHDLSIPTKMDFSYTGNYADEIMKYKAKAWWYNITPSDVDVLNIWPTKQVSKNDRQVTVLDFVFDPALAGMYNYDHTNGNIAVGPNNKNWGGMMKVLSSTANNLVDENMEFIEFWMQLDPDDPNNANITEKDSLFIDLGKISEDVIPNNKLDTEDKNGNSLLDNGEDIGIDYMTNDQERAYAAEKGFRSSNENDPAGDDFAYSPGSNPKDPNSFLHINGTQGNGASIEAGKLPDSEDLKNQYSLETTNSYFRYSVSLDTLVNSGKDKNPYIVGGGNTNHHWHQFRIPLKDFKDKEGSPSLSVVEYIRLWINGVSHRVHVRLADFNLVGSQWQKVAASNTSDTEMDPTLELSVISVDENSPEYYSPSGVSKEQDKSKVDEQVYRNEQSLNLILKNLPGQAERKVVKFVRAIDLFNYSEMKMFVHGDKDPAPNNLSYNGDQKTFNAEVYFRFGSDTSNYYEFSQPVKPDWQEISIPFSAITALKQAREQYRKENPKDTSLVFSQLIQGTDGNYYRIKGNPALTNVSFFLLGVKNLKPA